METIKVLKHQADFINSQSRHTGLVGGYRSGKSQALVYKTLAKKMEMPGINVAYYMPTYGLIRDVAFDKFEEVLTIKKINYTLNLSLSEIETQFGKIIFRSMDNPDRIIGYEVGYSGVDECDLIPFRKMKQINKRIIARNSVKSRLTNNATDYVSTPEGFGFLYNFFVKEGTENKKLIRASTYDNPFISDDYIDSLKEDYTANELKAYLNGEFVNFSMGNVYYSFKRTQNHSNRTIEPNDILHIGMDFNITNMSAVVRVMDGSVSTAVAEITKAYDTAQMIEIIKSRYPNHKIVIYPDASSKNRRSAGQSDLDLIKEAGLLYRINEKNPNIADRVTIVNKTFLNAKGEITNFINTNLCPELTEAYEQLGYRNGLPDKESGFDHLTDADGYCVCGLLGVRKPRASFGSGGRLL